MKTALPVPETVRRPSWQKKNAGRREQIPLSDLSDCLLAAYDGVSRLAFQRYVARGSRPGNDLQDWKGAQQDLFVEAVVDFAETEGDLYALTAIAGYAGKEITVAVDEHWLLVWGRGESDTPASLAAAGGMDLHGRDLSVRSEALHSNISSEEHECIPASSPAPAAEHFEGCVVPRPFCVLELRVKVDPARSVAVLANGLLAVRMRKAGAGLVADSAS